MKPENTYMSAVQRILLARFCLFALIVPAGGWAQEVPVRPGLNAGLADLARFAEEVLVEAGVRDWSVAFIHDARVVERRFSEGVGNTGKPVNAGTLFRMHSVAKPVIAWGVMKLVEMGRLELDRPIESYLTRYRLPPSVFDHQEVTVRRVLSHTAGLSWGRREQFAPYEVLPPIEEVLAGSDAAGRRLEVIVEPGTRFIYSSGGYTLLELLIEEVSGRPFAEFMKAEVLSPLGMERTVFAPAEPSDAPVTRTMDALGMVSETDDRPATARGLTSSLDELTAFALAHLDGESGGWRGRGVLQPATLDPMLSPVSAARSLYGLGYFTRRLDGGLVIAGHGGGSQVDFRVVPATEDGLVILTNYSSGVVPIERIQCVWISWLTRTEARCPMPASYALLGAYRRGGLLAALDYYSNLVESGNPDYIVGLDQLSEFARMFLGAGQDVDAADVYRFMARSATAEAGVYEEVADRLATGFELPEDRLHCYLGEYRSSSGETIRLERTGDGLLVTIVAGPGGPAGIGAPVRPLSTRVFIFDLDSYLGELVFELAESGAATRATVRDMAFGITLTAARSGAGLTC
jgi:CubicO group peptidase (beta-lactamase class C family)